MKKLFISTILFGCMAVSAIAQEIPFEDYENYTITVAKLNGTDFDFGQVVSGRGNYSININNAKIVEIIGVKYLDVRVTVTGPDYLLLNDNPDNDDEPNKRIPFTLKAAYANNSGTPTIGQAKFITNITNNDFVKYFPILGRKQGSPPGPPPTPPTDNFDQSKVEETAYLYLYGSIDVRDVNAGNYSATIHVTVEYD